MPCNQYVVKSTLKYFHVHSEEELYDFIREDSKKLPCVICGKEWEIEHVEFSNGDPICPTGKGCQK